MSRIIHLDRGDGKPATKAKSRYGNKVLKAIDQGDTIGELCKAWGMDRPNPRRAKDRQKAFQAFMSSFE